jgi:hypothetical protein
MAATLDVNRTFDSIPAWAGPIPPQRNDAPTHQTPYSQIVLVLKSSKLEKYSNPNCSKFEKV